MSDYNHSSALKEVTEADRSHVNFMLNKLDDYACSGGKEGLGDFLMALVTGDLEGATARADDTNIKYLRTYMQYIYCHVPCEHVNLGRPVFRAIQQLRKEEEKPVSQKMVEEALGDFKFRLRELMKAQKTEG